MKMKNQCFCKYLKPGALAQIRNSKISAKSHKPRSLTQLLTHSVQSVQINGYGGGDDIPCFVMSRIYRGGPRCLRRKKLVASGPVFLLNLEANNVFNNDNNNNNNTNAVASH